jgi:hypothetical protein
MTSFLMARAILLGHVHLFVDNEVRHHLRLVCKHRFGFLGLYSNALGLDDPLGSL